MTDEPDKPKHSDFAPAVEVYEKILATKWFWEDLAAAQQVGLSGLAHALESRDRSGAKIVDTIDLTIDLTHIPGFPR